MPNIIFSLLIVVFSMFFLIQSLKLPIGTSSNIGAGAWPTTVLLLLMSLGIILLVKSSKKMKALQYRGEVETQDRGDVIEIKFPRMHLIVTLLIFSYVLSINILGFLTATPFFIFILAFLLGMSNWIKLIITALSSSFVIVYVFTIVLNVPLPRGVGIFRAFSLLIY
ncbi:TctB transporter component [Alkalihalophilus pseudofirmus OF4]|uniref:TctB transporter component n=2 Tax=Alkalihalophilus pseudofirmus TaxID=79885 RepID=D3FWQ2_ALKPO|nr:tripartite tricarboxylate transporter TctB family protein [Alkalihalophilus pseudofirmus]ADC50550.1 TctB transporter component [Alkalihalophilus pseudofirmus OF4]MDV2883699.1 tripartite tricarboxylate transporter TctB family protein [Alkalihalophilus pseudofirmus]